MASITINIPTVQANRVLDAIAANNGYTGFLADEVTAQTKVEFAKAFLITDIKGQVRAYEQNIAINNAYATTAASVESGITLT